MIARPLTITMAVAVVLAAAFTPVPADAQTNACPTINHPNELVIEGGSGQTAQLGKPFSENLQVALANKNGCPLTGNLAGINLEFDAPGSGASGVFATGSNHAVVGTNAQGVATAPELTANFTAGAYTVDVDSDYGTVELYLWNTAAGLAASIAGGTPTQEASIDAQFAQPLQARVLDANGNPVQGATVDFSVVPGVTGASATLLGEPSVTTDANGLATSPPLLANGIPGRYAATASTAGVATIASYGLDNHATAVTLSSPSRSAQTATVGTSYRRRLVTSVLDASGQPIEGAAVTFAITPSAAGAGASFAGGAVQADAVTGVDGVATSPALVANKTAGTFSATAATTLAQTPLVFALRNLAGSPATIAAGAASGETTAPGARFPVRLAVTVTDKNGNPVAGAVLTFRAPVHGATGFFLLGSHRRVSVARVRTNAAGIAVAPPFVANRKAGGYAVSATAGGKRAAFALRNERS
ncbi:MAG TPA: Ig-like domain-containing protein [Gaiellaceae bacterium]